MRWRVRPSGWPRATYHGSFFTQRAGTASRPITLTGPRTAVLVNDGPAGTAPSCPAPTAGWDSGYGLWLFNAPYWRLTGFTVRRLEEGDRAGQLAPRHGGRGSRAPRRRGGGALPPLLGRRRDPQLDHRVHRPGAARLRRGCLHWLSELQLGLPRQLRRRRSVGPGPGAESNRIGPNVAAESIDIKEGTFDGVIRGNTFDGRGISGQNSADSWVDAKGIGYLHREQHRHLQRARHVRQRVRDPQPDDHPGLPERVRQRVARQRFQPWRGGAVRDKRHLDIEVPRKPERGLRVEHGHQRGDGSDQHRGHALANHICGHKTSSWLQDVHVTKLSTCSESC